MAEKILIVGVMIERLKQFFNLKSDTDLANRMGMKVSTLAAWKNRNNFDFNEVYTFCINENINLDWLLTGEGNPDKNFIQKPATDETKNLKAKIAELEETIKKMDASDGSDNKETARLNSEIAELRAKLNYADSLIEKFIIKSGI